MKTICTTVLITALMGTGSPAFALGSDWWEGQNSRIRLIAAETALGADGQITLGLEITMEPGWKTYWRTPGEAGIPPRFDWSASVNLGQVDIAWPTPTRVEYYGLDAFTYADRVVLPVTVTAARADEAIDLKLTVDLGICSDLCILETAELNLPLPAGRPGTSPHAADIKRAVDSLPAPSDDQLSLADAVITRDAGRTFVQIAVTGWTGPGGEPMAPGSGYDVFVEAGPEYLFGRARYQPPGSGRAGRFLVPLIAGPDGSHNRVEVRVTAVSPSGAVEIPLIVSDPEGL